MGPRQNVGVPLIGSRECVKPENLYQLKEHHVNMNDIMALGSAQSVKLGSVACLWEWFSVKVGRECPNLFHTNQQGKPEMGLGSRRNSPGARSSMWRWEFGMETSHNTGFLLCLYFVAWCKELDPVTGSGVEWIPLLLFWPSILWGGSWVQIFLRLLCYRTWRIRPL